MDNKHTHEGQIGYGIRMDMYDVYQLDSGIYFQGENITKQAHSLEIEIDWYLGLQFSQKQAIHQTKTIFIKQKILTDKNRFNGCNVSHTTNKQTKN